MVHSKYLDILAANIKSGQQEVDLVEILPMEHKKNEFLVFRTKNNVPRGNYTINIGKVSYGNFVILVQLQEAINVNADKVPNVYYFQILEET